MSKQDNHTDIFSVEKRSDIMSRVRSTNSKVELAVRKWLHGKGYRFRLHMRDLPGVPDIVLPKYRIIIFVNGCFWHQHPGCKKATLPKQNREFWAAKLARNIRRDKEVELLLIESGWQVVTLWECEIQGHRFEDKLLSYLEPGVSTKKGPNLQLG